MTNEEKQLFKTIKRKYNRWRLSKLLYKSKEKKLKCKNQKIDLFLCGLSIGISLVAIAISLIKIFIL